MAASRSESFRESTLQCLQQQWPMQASFVSSMLQRPCVLCFTVND